MRKKQIELQNCSCCTRLSI